MNVIRHLAAILQKAQHRIDAETGQPIDVGRQVQYIKHEFVRLQKKTERLQRAENDQWQAAEQMRKAWRDRRADVEKLQRKLMIVTNFPTHPGGHPGDQSDNAMCEADWRHGWICAVSAIQDALAATDQEPTP